MNANKRLKVGILLAFIAALIVVIGFAVSHKVAKERPFAFSFLPSYGDFNMQKGAENPIELYYVVKNPKSDDYKDFEAKLLEGMEISAKGQTLFFSPQSVSKLLTTKTEGETYTLYNIHLTVRAEMAASDGSAFSVDAFPIDGSSYRIGALDFKFFEAGSSGGDLHLYREMKLSASDDLEPYHAIFQNRGTEEISVTGVDLGKFTNANIVWDGDNGVPSSEGLPFLFPVGSEHRMEILFDDSIQENVRVYYFSPVVHYTTPSNDGYIAMSGYRSGIPQSETTLRSLCSTIFGG